MKLWCAIVGPLGYVFSVDIDMGQTVADLKEAIKAKNEDVTVPARKLQLFLAKKGGKWVTEEDVANNVKTPDGLTQLVSARAEIGDVGLSEDDVQVGVTKEAKEAIAALQGPVNVLVVIPEGGKRHPSNEWFAESSHPLKKRRVGEDEERRLFDMRGFPPLLLAHLKVEFKTIVERKAYVVIFAQLVQHAKACFEYIPTSASEPDKKSEPGKDSNVIVTGNPGTGKSRFFLYCIFQLIRREREDVKQFPPYELVLNYDKDFLKYDATSTEFVELNKEDVRALKAKPHVLRLVEGTSSELVGWRGVSVLFASPGVDGLGNFAKVDGLTYIMPTWTFEELEEYNSLLPIDLKLAEDELVSRYDTFGGIPWFVFSQGKLETETQLKTAIDSFSVLEIISYCRRNAVVNYKNYNHSVLQMIPTQANFRATFHLDFQSMHIADAFIDKVHGESLARVLEFAVHDTDDPGSTALIRGKIYELLCHKWFNLHERMMLHFRSLCSTTRHVEYVTIPKEMETVRFASLDKLELAKSWTYYRPTSKTFGALDAFIWDGHSKCYGLQMTLNADHGINATPLNKFLERMKKAGMDQFYFTFVAPSKIATSYRKQSARTATDADSKKAGVSVKVDQFVFALDVVGLAE